MKRVENGAASKRFMGPNGSLSHVRGLKSRSVHVFTLKTWPLRPLETCQARREVLSLGALKGELELQLKEALVYSLCWQDCFCTALDLKK